MNDLVDMMQTDCPRKARKDTKQKPAYLWILLFFVIFVSFVDSGFSQKWFARLWLRGASA